MQIYLDKISYLKCDLSKCDHNTLLAIGDTFVQMVNLQFLIVIMFINLLPNENSVCQWPWLTLGLYQACLPSTLPLE